MAKWLLSIGCAILLAAGSFRTATGSMASPYLPIDFADYYVAAKIVTSGKGSSLYDRQLQRQLLAKDVPGILDIQDEIPPFIYPPAAVVLGMPLAWLPFDRAAYIWLALSTAALAGYGCLLVRLAGLRGRPWAALAVLAAVFLFPPAQEALLLGQVTPLLAFFVALGFLMALFSPVPRAQETAGAALGLAGVIKLFPAALFLPWLLASRWRLITAGLLIVLVATAFGIMLPQGLQASLVYVTSVVPNLPRPWSPPEPELGFHPGHGRIWSPVSGSRIRQREPAGLPVRGAPLGRSGRRTTGRYSMPNGHPPRCCGRSKATERPHQGNQSMAHHPAGGNAPGMGPLLSASLDIPCSPGTIPHQVLRLRVGSRYILGLRPEPLL